jgi:hypothetical protein
MEVIVAIVVGLMMGGAPTVTSRNSVAVGISGPLLSGTATNSLVNP